jgi:2,4-dienoyl-CoA reductase (NADPH2)
VVVETASVHESDWPYERAPLADRCAEGWAAVAEAVHAHGGLALASLGHAGGQGSSAYSQAPLWGPSRFPDPVTREVPQEMEAEDIAVVVEGFRAAAARALAAGLDGVEVNAGQLSLLRQFLSGLTNQRTDQFGTDRTLLVRQVLAAARRGLGPGPVLGLRLAVDELAPWAGITPEAGAELARELGPLVDYVVAVRAPAFDLAGTRPDGHTEEGFALPLATAVRQVVPPAVAVVAQGSIVEVAMAEAALAEGRAEVIEMTRAQIADPDLVAKVAAGHPEQVRPCVLCNQRCTVRDARNPIVSCIGEPSSGHELTDPDWEDVSGRRRPPVPVLVVGAGPAGLEAARLAGRRGHPVRVVEAGRRTGGLLRTAAAGSGRGHLARLADWLEAEARRAGAAVETGVTASQADLDDHRRAGGAVIVATGSGPGRSRYDDDGSLLRISAADLLGRAEAGTLDQLPEGPVVVDDPVGNATGVAVAELLAAAGRPVALVTGDLVAGTQLSLTGDLAPANARLARAGVEVVKGSVVTEVLDGVVRLANTYTGAKDERPAAVLVDAGARLPAPLGPVDGPEANLVVGDAVAPRTVYEAVLEARRAVLAVAGAGPAGGAGPT